MMIYKYFEIGILYLKIYFFDCNMQNCNRKNLFNNFNKLGLIFKIYNKDLTKDKFAAELI